MRVLFVCLGNICRSPTAEAAVKEALDGRGIAERVQLDSAGTGSWHIGKPPDRRMSTMAAQHGLRLGGVARQFTSDDFDLFDLICVMDRSNLAEVLAQARNDADREKVRLFREFDPDRDHDEVPDPYFGGSEDFRHVVSVARDAAAGLAEHLAKRVG